MKRVMFVIALLLLAIPGVIAAEMTINVKTVPDTKNTLLIFNEGGNKILKERVEYPDSNGEYSYDFSTDDDIESVKISIKVKDEKEEKILLLENFGVFDFGEELWLQAIPGNISKDYMKVHREMEAKKAEEEAKKAAEEAEAKRIADEEAAVEAARIAVEEAEAAKFTNKIKSITGKVSFESLGEVSKKTYYIAGGILLVLVLGFMMVRHGMPSIGGGNMESLQKSLSREQDKVRDIKEKIAKLRGSKEERIRKMEEKLKQDEDELRKLVGKKRDVAKKKIEDKKDDIEEAKEKAEKDD